MWALKLFSRLPLRVLYLVADVLFFFSFYVVGYRRKIVQANLQRALPELDAAGRARIEKAFFRNLANYGVETLKLQTISPQELQRRMVYRNPEILRRLGAVQVPVIALASHHFNWEWLIAAAVLQVQLPFDYVYQAQPNAFFDRLSNYGRSRFGAYPIRRQVVAREAMRRKNVFRCIGILADQFPGHLHDKRYWAPFLHQDTAFFQGVNQLAIQMQYPVVYLTVRKVKRGYYEAEVIPLAHPPYAKDSLEVISRYIQETEKAVRARPAEWLWSHKRWKKTRAEWGDDAAT